MLAQKLGIPEIQFTDQTKLKKKEDRSMDTLVLLRRGNKIPMEGDTETKCGKKTEGKTIPRLTHWGSIPSADTKPRHYYRCQQVLTGA